MIGIGVTDGRTAGTNAMITDGKSVSSRANVSDDPRRDFEEFCAASSHGLTMQLYAYLGDLHEAQDLVQEAFCRAYARWNKVRHYDEPAAWVRRVAWNLATSRLRRQRTAQRFIALQRGEGQVPGPDPDRVALTRALAAIPANQRKALVLHHMAQLTVPEIAKQEGVPDGTVKSWLSRGRAALAAQLTESRKGQGNV
jgi:RNA polymerase sigma-70 factor (ECF subfamily)